MQLIQEILLKIYELFQKIGLFEMPWFRRIFLASYFLYKKYLEDPFYGLTRKRKDIFKGGYILDIGANIGYTSFLFANVVAPGFKVYSFEPDGANFESLIDVVKRYRLEQKVAPVHAAVGEKTGTIEFWHNKKHSGDHRVFTREFQAVCDDLADVSVVKLWQIDDFVDVETIASQIKFIKIDVQGYELPVCLGMEKTLRENPEVVVALEYAPESLRELGFEPTDLLRFFQDRQYLIHILHQSGDIELAKEAAMNKILAKRGYVDFLCSKKRL